MNDVIRAIVFDLDGVLVDAREWHYEALNKALAMFSFNISRYEHLSTYDGLPTREKLERLSVEKGLPSALHGLISSLKQQFTQDIIALQCRPRFEKEYMLSRLKERGMKLAVASNAVKDSVEVMLTRSGIIHYFDFLLSNEDVSSPKPDPEIYKMAANRLGLPANEILVIEDNHYGVEAATASGCHVIRVVGVDDVRLDLIQEFLDRE